MGNVRFFKKKFILNDATLLHWLSTFLVIGNQIFKDEVVLMLGFYISTNLDM